MPNLIQKICACVSSRRLKAAKRPAKSVRYSKLSQALSSKVHQLWKKTGDVLGKPIGSIKA